MARQKLLAEEDRTAPPDGGVREALTGTVEHRGLAGVREAHVAAVPVREQARQSRNAAVVR
jgi:hypothetical protein